MSFTEDFEKFSACLQEYAQANKLNEDQVLNAFANEMLKQRSNPPENAQASQQINENPNPMTNIEPITNVKPIINPKYKPKEL